MATNLNYYVCDVDGNRITVNITLTKSALKTRTYNLYDNLKVTETYRTLTFTLDGDLPPTTMVIAFNYQVRQNVNYAGLTDWSNVNQVVKIPAGTTKVTKDVYIYKTICGDSSYDDGGGDGALPRTALPY